MANQLLTIGMITKETLHRTGERDLLHETN
jgi:hypothetical protein